MRLAVHLQRNLDLHVLVLLVLMSSFVETSAVQVGLHGHTLDANDHDEGPLPRIAATADHPLLKRRHQRRAELRDTCNTPA